MTSGCRAGNSYASFTSARENGEFSAPAGSGGRSGAITRRLFAGGPADVTPDGCDDDGGGAVFCEHAAAINNAAVSSGRRMRNLSIWKYTGRFMFSRDLLAGKTAIVTGGGTGLGLAMATKFATLGANVVLASRSEEHLAGGASAVTKAAPEAGVLTVV